MTTTTTMASNGKLRKSLADQIDRLDGILDGLADALNGAVTSAVKDAVGQAVREAVHSLAAEIQSHPAVRQLIQKSLMPSMTPAQPQHKDDEPRPGGGKLAAARSWIGSRVQALYGRCKQGAYLASAAMRRAWQWTCERFGTVAVALAGLVLAGVTYLVRTRVADLMSKCCHAARDRAIRAWASLRRLRPAALPAGG
jgi:hypothetical protein